MFKKPQTPIQALQQIIDLQSKPDQIPEFEKAVAALKIIVSQPIQDCPDLFSLFYSSNIFIKLIMLLPNLSFETKKDVIQIMQFFIRHGAAENNDVLKAKIIDYVLKQHPEIINKLLSNLDTDSGLLFGQIIQDLIKYPELAKHLLNLLYNTNFDQLIKLMNSTEFDVSSEACMLFKDLLKRHEQVVQDFVEGHPQFFCLFSQLLKTQNFATKRFSLQLLADMLLDRSNFQAMKQFCEQQENLKLVMILLRDSSQVIRQESFHIFKIFVANPEKNPEISKILYKNKDKLVEYLTSQKYDSEEAEEERLQIIDMLKEAQE